MSFEKLGCKDVVKVIKDYTLQAVVEAPFAKK
jgi:hypothetical protein